jgi:hypothetical protein
MKKQLLITVDVPEAYNDYSDNELQDALATLIHSIKSDTQCKILDTMASDSTNEVKQAMIDGYKHDIKLIDGIVNYKIFDVDTLAKRLIENTFDIYKAPTTVINEYIA